MRLPGGSQCPEYPARAGLPAGFAGYIKLDLQETRMPLTTRGICVQILASVQAHYEHGDLCTTNDCKVVLNHLVRKFSEPLSRANKQKRLTSRRVAAGETDDTVDDHAVPVMVLVEKLLELSPPKRQVNHANIDAIEQFLTSSLVIVEITRDEDLRLCSSGFQRCMPKGWELESVVSDPLARYKAAGVEV